MPAGRRQRGPTAAGLLPVQRAAQEGVYVISLDHQVSDYLRCVEIKSGCTTEVCFELGIDLELTLEVIDKQCQAVPCARPTVGDRLQLGASGNFQAQVHELVPPEGFATLGDRYAAQAVMRQAGHQQFSGAVNIAARQAGDSPAVLRYAVATDVDPQEPTPVTGNLTVSHKRRVAEPDGPMSFFVHLLDASSSLGFNHYQGVCRTSSGSSTRPSRITGLPRVRTRSASAPTCCCARA